MKSLIIFYSLSGNTKLIANIIKKQISADILELKPEKEIPKKGFFKFFIGGMHALFNKKIKLINQSVDINCYDKIFIGTPVWAGSISSPVKTYLRQIKITNKSLAFFTASAGPDEKCLEKLKKALKNNNYLGGVNIVNSLQSDESKIENEIIMWLSSLK